MRKIVSVYSQETAQASYRHGQNHVLGRGLIGNCIFPGRDFNREQTPGAAREGIEERKGAVKVASLQKQRVTCLECAATENPEPAIARCSLQSPKPDAISFPIGSTQLCDAPHNWG